MNIIGTLSINVSVNIQEVTTRTTDKNDKMNGPNLVLADFKLYNMKN